MIIECKFGSISVETHSSHQGLLALWGEIYCSAVTTNHKVVVNGGNIIDRSYLASESLELYIYLSYSFINAKLDLELWALWDFIIGMLIAIEILSDIIA